MNGSREIVSILILLCGVTGCATSGKAQREAATPEASAAGAATDDLAAFMTRQMDTAKFPGLAACIVKGDSVRWAQGFGYADIASSKPVTPDTLFLLGSVAKAVTAVAVMQLVEAGMIDLDADVNTYLPFEVRNPAHPRVPICARMLLAHTSSIRDDADIYRSLYTLNTGGGDSPMPLRQFLEHYLATGGDWIAPGVTYTGFAPGSQFHHSNVGVALAGYLVEAVSGLSFDAYCKRRIFEPLGMTDSHWFLSETNIENVATPHRFDIVAKVFVPYAHYGHPAYPDGQLRASVSQFARLIIALMNDGRLEVARVLRRESVEELFTIQYPDQNPDLGLVWWYGLIGGHEAIGLDGGDAGVCTSVFFLRQEKIGVLLFANGDCSVIGDGVRFAIQERLLREAAAR